ncbi:hypothetical protein KEM48_009980 [Puccinia striiformis f. sp. tritici PST-130]|nr:hypothetical protein KEM48_009980 [Puccinia striiformis f. sp. tritici PST-130]
MVEPTSSPELISRGQIEFSVRYCSPKESSYCLIYTIEYSTGVYASACFGGMVISEGIRVLYRFPQDSTLMRAMVCGSWDVHYYTQGSSVKVTIHFVNSTTNSNWTSNSWFEYIAYHYAVDGFHDVRLLNMVTPHLGAHILHRAISTSASGLISGDILITGSLLYYLGKQKTHYIKTKSFLTTALAIVSIGLLGAQRELGILYCLTLISAQLYLLSILVTLNSRFDFAKAFAEDANKSLSRSFRMARRFTQNFIKSKTREWPGPGDGVSIQVDQVVFTDFDEDILASPRFTKVRPGNGQDTMRSPAVPILDNFTHR